MIHQEEDNINTVDHQIKMKELMKIREVEALNREILRLTPQKLKRKLREEQLSTRGDRGVQQDRLLRAGIRGAGLELGRVPSYDDDTRCETNPDKESISEDETMAEQQKSKKRRGRKPEVIHDKTEESAVTTDSDARIIAGPNRTQINEGWG